MATGSGAGPIPYIEKIVGGLAQANVAAAAIFATIKIIRDMWKKAKPKDPAITDATLIDICESTFRKLGVDADAEIARLKGGQSGELFNG